MRPKANKSEAATERERPSCVRKQSGGLFSPRGDRSRFLRRENGKTVWFKSHPRNQRCEPKKISVRKTQKPQRDMHPQNCIFASMIQQFKKNSIYYLNP